MKDSRSKAAAVASGSWFHNRIVDGKKDSLCTVVLLYGTIYLCCCALVAAPRWCMNGGGSIATSPLIIRYIISPLFSNGVAGVCPNSGGLALL